jgi:flavin-dependent dehydrogenase
MMLTRYLIITAMASATLCCSAHSQTVIESARDIPLVYDVDVVVVGGTTRGVAAAVAAAEKGAKVFLAAPRPYLGEDMCATYRLWLEGGETPTTDLGHAIFSESRAGSLILLFKNGLPFSYSASIPSASKHPDTSTPSRLADGRHGSAATESVQYDGDVTIVADLGKVTTLSGVHLVAYQRAADFEIRDVVIETSADKTAWSQVAKVANPKAGAAGDIAVDLSVPAEVSARYVRLSVARNSGSERILLGELIVTSPDPKPVVSKPTRFAVPPMQVKTALDEALLAAKVDFLYGCYVTDLLRDRGGKLAGIVMANRSGRQAVRAKVIIDATDRAIAARLAGAEFSPYPAGKQKFSRMVVGGTAREGARETGHRVVVRESGRKQKDQTYQTYEYRLKLPMKDGSWTSFARADQQARNMTWQEGQVGAAEMLFQVPPDPLRSRGQQAGPWPGAAGIDLDAMRPAGVDGIYVLGGCADISREAAGQLLRPLNGIALGARVGTEAAKAASTRKTGPVGELSVSAGKAPSATAGEVGEMLNGIRSMADSSGQQTVKSPARGVPVIARYDVVVVGGGTGGAPAGIGAARGGARTLVLEYLHGLGGVGTLGRISNYYHGNKVGFTAEVDKGVGTGRNWNIEKKMEWFRSEIVKAGGDVWFQTLGCGSVVRGKQFVGVLVATPHGRGVVLANTVIDSTGNAVIPACAGLPCQEIGGDHISVQGTGLPHMTPGQSYWNTDWTFSDDDDVLDMWRMFVVGKKKYANAFDLGQLINTRARRRIIGDVMITPMDIINKRTYPDVVTVAKSNFDNHGFSSHTLFMVTPPDRAGLTGNVPYRALMPKGHDGILVTGLGISAHGDAMPVLRMQPDVQNQGYAAGKAAAMAAESGTTVRKIDVKKLQKHLVEKGIIPPGMLTAGDSYPIGPEKMQTAVKNIADNYKGISLILTDPETAMPELRKAWQKADSKEAKLRYAHVLGMLRDGTGAGTLVDAVEEAKWDKGWNFRGMGQYGATTSPLDNLVIALGRTGDKRGVDVVIAKLRQLTAGSEFSHCRAVAMSLEISRDTRAAKPLAEFMQQEGVMGYAFTEIHDTIERSPESRTDNSTRQKSLRELILARALYRCGDHNGLGEKILTEYARDLRGLYARHAKAVLKEE